VARCGTALQAGRSWVRFPMVSLEFFVDIEMSTTNISWGGGQRRPVRRAATLPTSCAECLEI
jgi:hypothetical protein